MRERRAWSRIVEGGGGWGWISVLVCVREREDRQTEREREQLVADLGAPFRVTLEREM